MVSQWSNCRGRGTFPPYCALFLGVGQPAPASAGDGARPAPKGKSVMRVAAAQPRDRTIDFRLTPAEALARVDASLGELEQLAHKAGAAGCDALALPEDTLGLLRWEAGNPAAVREV